ncbi:hypothetical protein GF386_03790 [Candidatus Pacearchaeota archaeon]|nr:hypothetical protein [Candidatus Pacearchaeota archaeon]
MKNKKIKHLHIILAQALFLIITFSFVFVFYPRTDVSISGNFVKFDSVNSDIIIISENSDFSNPSYIDLKKLNNISFSLKPGSYYWKPSNGIIEGFTNKFIIKSEVGLGIERDENTSLVNIGNVKVNVTKNKEGVMVGRIILEPEESEKIEDKGEYTARQEN